MLRSDGTLYRVVLRGEVWEQLLLFMAILMLKKYQEILDENWWPVIGRHFPTENYIFQQDNAPLHKARSTQEYLHRNDVTMYLHELASTESRPQYHRVCGYF